MFTDNRVGSISVHEDAAFVHALRAKLVDIDKNRIHSSDDLVLRKAVFGLLEVTAVLEQRIAALESETVREGWNDRVRTELRAATPDQVRLGE